MMMKSIKVQKIRDSRDNRLSSFTLKYSICIGLAVIIWRKDSKIDTINKKNAENNAKTEALVKNLQDQLEELRNVRKTSSKTNVVDSSGDEYQNVYGLD